MKINVIYIPQEQEIEVYQHDCFIDGHIMEEVELDPNYLAWNGDRYDMTNLPTEYGQVCKYCDYQEVNEDYEDD